jgi:archaemetzincin
VKNLYNLLTLVFFLLAPQLVLAQSLTIAIQPFGQFDAKLTEKVKQTILATYKVNVIILPTQELPKEAYYQPRNRYRAEKLALYLNKIDSKTTKILGLTVKDISTTKGEYVDWGILGLALLDRRPAIVSTFRMGKGKASEKLFLERLGKVVNHEIGHTFGLDHCPNLTCIMEDAKGTIKTVDKEKDFCSDCKIKLSGKLK